MNGKRCIGLKQRLEGFEEIVLPLSEKDAIEEAKRCLQCLEPKCVQGCPASVNCKEFIRLLREGKKEEAAKEILLHNPAPCITGRVCNAGKQCEGECILAKSGSAINISGLERFVADNSSYSLNGFPAWNGKKIAIIGSGPAGLVAALDLRKKGYSVKIFESEKRIGGLLVDAIPQYRLPREITKKFLGQIKAVGIEVQTETIVGEQVLLDDLRKEFDAVLIAAGEDKAKQLKVKGNGLSGVLYWNGFLRNFNEKTRKLAKKRIIVIGGGDTAIDCCRVALRNHAEVRLVYRKPQEFMPAQKAEIEEALKEGLKFSFLLSPMEFVGEKKLNEVVFEKVTVEKEHFVMSGKEERIPCDIAIVAAGQEQDIGILNGTELEGQPLEVHSTKTKLDKVFVAGDLANKNKTVIHAIRSAREAVKDIDDFLNGRSIIPEGITKI